MTTADRQILSGIGWITLFVVVGRVAGAAKEMAVAWRFGVGPALDGYLFVLNIVMLPVGVWFSVLCAVLVPMAAGWHNQSSPEMRCFSRELLMLTLGLGTLGAAVAALVLPPLARLPALGLSSPAVATVLEVSTVMSLIIPAGMVAGLGSAWLLAAGRHANTLFEAVPAVTILIAVVVATSSIVSLAWATALGVALQCIVVSIALRALLPQRAADYGSSTVCWRRFRRGIGIMVAAQVLWTLAALVDLFFTARLNPGSIAVLGYATRITALVLGICATAVSRSTLPVFSQLQHDQVSARLLARAWTLRTLCVGSLLAIVGWVSAEPLVRLLFERGAFTVQDTNAVAETLRMLLLQLPPYCAGIVFVSWASACGHLRLVFAAALCAFVVKLVATAVLVDAYGLSGVAASSALMYATTFGVLVTGFARTRPSMTQAPP